MKKRGGLLWLVLLTVLLTAFALGASCGGGDGGGDGNEKDDGGGGNGKNDVLGAAWPKAEIAAIYGDGVIPDFTGYAKKFTVKNYDGKRAATDIDVSGSETVTADVTAYEAVLVAAGFSKDPDGGARSYVIELEEGTLYLDITHSTANGGLTWFVMYLR